MKVRCLYVTLLLGALQSDAAVNVVPHHDKTPEVSGGQSAASAHAVGLPMTLPKILIGQDAFGNIAITLADPISFTSTGSDQNIFRLVVEDVFVERDPDDVTNLYGSVTGGEIPVSGSGIVGTVYANAPWVSPVLNFGEYDPNDLLLSWDGEHEADGTYHGINPDGGLVTFSPGTIRTNQKFWKLQPLLSGNPRTIVLADNQSNALSGSQLVLVQIVPEPSVSALVMGGIAAWLCRRKRLRSA